MRHPLVTIQLISKARDAAIAQAQADERLEHRAEATPDTQPAELGRFARAVALAGRVRCLVERTS
jgi:hypothetical protein